MSDIYVIAVKGIENANSLEELPEKIRNAAVRAINRAAERARTESARVMQRQVNFPAGYLNPSQDRLVVTKKAAGMSLRAIVSGRTRPTSLARFIQGSPKRGQGVDVMVKPGSMAHLDTAFAIQLKRGDTGLRGNLGLAIRTDGGPPRNAYKPKQIGENLYLLYGPSVNQVFKDVRGQVAPDIEDFLESEIRRQVEI